MKPPPARRGAKRGVGVTLGSGNIPTLPQNAPAHPDLNALFPVPPELQRAAWLAARTARLHWPTTYRPADWRHYDVGLRFLCRIARGMPGDIGWSDARAVFHLYRAMFGTPAPPPVRT